MDIQKLVILFGCVASGCAFSNRYVESAGSNPPARPTYQYWTVNLKVTSEPSGASVDVDQMHVGNTPLEVPIKCTRVLYAGQWTTMTVPREVTVFPSGQQTGYSQTKEVDPCQWDGATSPAVNFNLGLKPVAPTLPIEVR